VKSTENEETETKALFAPAQFYDACDECDSLPEERWEVFRQKLDDQKSKIEAERERVRPCSIQSTCTFQCVSVFLDVEHRPTKFEWFVHDWRRVRKSFDRKRNENDQK
jgi:hypothetical protein